MRILRYSVFVSLIAFSSIWVVGQSNKPPVPKAVDNTSVSATDFFGTAVNGIYTNRFLGFRLSAPEKYIFIEAVQADIESRAGIEMLKGGNNAANKKIDEALAKQVTLFGWLELPQGTPGNSVIEALAVKQGKGVTAPLALAASTRMITTNPDVRIERSLGNVKISGRDFSGAILRLKLNGIELYQEYYITMLRGYSVHFTLTYFNDEGRQKMLKVLRSIEFSK